MPEFLQILPEQLLKIKWLRTKRELMNEEQWRFVDSIKVATPLTDDQALILGQIYRLIHELEELPLWLERGVHYVAVDDPSEYIG